MNSDKDQFLNLRTPPARLNAEQVGWYSGFPLHEIPLGHPAKNAPKFFAFITLEEFHGDKATPPGFRK